MNNFFARRTLAAAFLALAGLIFTTPALAANQLLFEWSGTDENNDPFDIRFTLTDAVNGDAGFTTNNFLSSFVEIYTEQPGDSQIISNVESSTLGGSFSYPASPFFFVFVSQGASASETFVQMTASANVGDIGLSFNGDVIEYMELGGAMPTPFVDPTTAGSLSDLFPLGTYAVSDGFGLLSWDSGGSNENLTPDTLTISAIPEPTSPIPEPASACLLGLAALGLLPRRRRQQA